MNYETTSWEEARAMSSLSYMDSIFKESFVKRGYKIKINFLLNVPHIYPDEKIVPIPEILEEPNYTEIALNNLKKLALKIGTNYTLIQGALYDEGPDSLPYVGIMQYQPVYDNYIPEYITPLEFVPIPVYDMQPRTDEFNDPYDYLPIFGSQPLPLSFEDPYIRFYPIYDESPDPYYGHLDITDIKYDTGPEYVSYSDPYYRHEYMPTYGEVPEYYTFEDPFSKHMIEPMYDMSPRADDFVDPFFMDAMYDESPEPYIIPKYKLDTHPQYDTEPDPYYEDMWHMAMEPMFDFGPEYITFADPYHYLNDIHEYDPPITLPLGFDPYAVTREPYFDEGPEDFALPLLRLYEAEYDMGPEWLDAPYIEHIPVYDSKPELQLLPEHTPIYGETPSFKIKLTANQYENVIERYSAILKRLNSNIIAL